MAPELPRVLPAAVLLPDLPPAVPRRRYPWPVPTLGRLVLRTLGWRWVGGFADAPRQVLVAWPHTSNWDGFLALAVVAALELDLRLFAKRQLFWPPLGWALRAFGAIPVDRSDAGGLVGRAVAELGRRDAFLLGLSPEGTRSHTDRWKTGFHRIAVEAGVPIGLAALDWARHEVGVVGTVVPSGDLEADLARIETLLDGIHGRHPERETPALAGR